MALSLVSLGAALLTLGLVQRWGETVPAAVLRLGGRPVPAGPVTATASVGALTVMGLCTMAVLNWSSVSGFSDNPESPWALLMIACYLPMLAWGPSLLIVTWAYWHRRRRVGLHSC